MFQSVPKKAISEYGEDITPNSRQQLPLSAYSHLAPSKQLPVSAYCHLGPTKYDKSQSNKSLGNEISVAQLVYKHG